MINEFCKKKEKTAIEVQEEYDLALRRMHEAQAKYDHLDFFHHKRKTNADRIRSLSDEELAEFLTSLTDPDWHKNDEYPYYKQTVDGWLYWLKSPAEKDEKAMYNPDEFFSAER